MKRSGDLRDHLDLKAFMQTKKKRKSYQVRFWSYRERYQEFIKALHSNGMKPGKAFEWFMDYVIEMYGDRK